MCNNYVYLKNTVILKSQPDELILFICLNNSIGNIIIYKPGRRFRSGNRSGGWQRLRTERGVLQQEVAEGARQ